MSRPTLSSTAHDALDSVLGSVIDQLTDSAIYAIDRHGVIRSWSAGAQSVFGHSPEEAIGSHFSMVYARDDRLAGVPLRGLNIAERDGRFEEDGMRVRKDGSRFAAHAAVYPLHKAGALVGFASVIRDISEKKQAENALHASERRFRALVEGITDYAVLLLDAEGTVTSWNDGAQRIYGYTADEIVGLHFARFFPEEIRRSDKPLSALETAAQTGRYEEECAGQRKDGTTFAAHVVINAILDDDGAVSGYAKLTRDVTERNSATRALRESEKRLRLLVESVTDHAIYTLDPSGIVTSWNHGAERITGYGVDEILGEHVSRFYTEADRREGRPYRALEVARADGRYEEEGVRVRKDGSRFAADIAIHAIYGEDGALAGYAKIARDVSERKMREQAESASAAKSRFLAHMSHEFRTPLNAIIGFSEIIKTELLGKIGNPRYVSYGNDIHFSGLHLLSLVNDLLDLTRIEAGKLEPVFRPTDVKQVAERAIQLFEPVIAAKRITIDLNVAGELQGFIADERMVRQCLVNLVDNAIKHSRTSSMVRVAVGRINDRLTIRVIDQGAGMAARDIPKALEPFGRVGDVSTTPVDGVGLGLPLVKSYCELHGGGIEIKSAPNAGTEVVLWFPYPGRMPDKPAGSTPRSPAAARRSERS